MLNLQCLAEFFIYPRGFVVNILLLPKISGQKLRKIQPGEAGPYPLVYIYACNAFLLFLFYKLLQLFVELTKQQIKAHGWICCTRVLIENFYRLYDDYDVIFVTL